MDTSQLVIIVAAIVSIGGFGVLAYVFLGGLNVGRQAEIRDLMSSASGVALDPSKSRKAGQPEFDVEEIKKRAGVAIAKKSKTDDVSSKLFKAGFYAAVDRKRFLFVQVVVFVAATVFIPSVMYTLVESSFLTGLAFILGILIGYATPKVWLERQIRKREEDILYYLPLVIEQVSIGVSSSLDIGPCLAHIVQMATDRDSHNPVTEMFVHVEKLIRSGLNLEDALVEVGDANGMTEVKHAFMFLAQCAKHGGELTKQLQELADSVMTQRQVQIEGKITALPVKATGPLITVFAGFFALLFAGLLVRLMSAFGT